MRERESVSFASLQVASGSVLESDSASFIHSLSGILGSTKSFPLYVERRIGRRRLLERRIGRLLERRIGRILERRIGRLLERRIGRRRLLERRIVTITILKTFTVIAFVILYTNPFHRGLVVIPDVFV